MASPFPVKSHALHNFALSPLKWKNNHPRGRSSASPLRGGGAGCESEVLEKGRNHNDLDVEKPKRVGLDHKGREESRSKILVRIPVGLQKNGGEVKGEEEVEVEGGEKAWNLRPRKAIKKSLNVNGGGGERGKNDEVLKKGIMNGGSEVVGVEKEKKVKFSICLTREEIEEDVYSISGLKPSRRPKKRAKIVQKQLDNLFPGLWLGAITPDSYRVSANYLKG